MPRKSRRRAPSGVFQKVVEKGEGALGQFAQEIAQSASLSEAVLGLLRRAAEAKGSFDQNMRSVLALLHLPSRSDYEALERKLEALQGNLVNVNIKLDRLLAELAALKRSFPSDGEKT
ncbi:MAG: hypothetical protein KatS3mg076_2690 [Candidatus Binatia bacterium]|nr:MAG: hypothetical protein KatS3mg076_2690 [Candidatus Binatia bacterium]